ncbi:hypothetical protein APY94_09320 [Thermococcus celericrescens]|uniref:Uncharacterized protein n=1 Tax=Thermococcus celericrescens TaxID=227598 RepID=A0A100XWQ9_9EURY|nr:hypothetical protein [Thermococcus celericrescens]KUH32614.1 hypothetical protein APY94_09320 [Thermococcus celericrescens]
MRSYKQVFYLVWFMSFVVSILGRIGTRVSVDVSVHITISLNIIIMVITLVQMQIIRITTPGAGPYWNQRWGTSLFSPIFSLTINSEEVI